jgi:hypothetical protein
MEEFNIFDAVEDKPRNFFKFEKVGDQVQGTYVGRNDNSVDGYNNPQTLVELLQKDGTVYTVSVRHNKVGILKELDSIMLGQIIGFSFTGTKENPGRSATKYIRIIHDAKFVNQDWINKQKLKQANMAAPVPTATTTAPASIEQIGELNVDDIFPSAEKAPVAPITPMSDSDKIREIANLAKAKLGAVSAEDVKTKTVEKTGLEFSPLNLDIILEKLKAL